MPNSVTIIILNWNGSEDTLRCVSSIAASDASNARIVVADNGSRLDQLEILRGEKGFTLISFPENLGFAGGNNEAIRCLGPDSSAFWMLLNNDTEVHPGFLTPLQSCLESNLADIASPLIHRGNRENPGQVWFGGARINWYIGRPMALSVRPASLSYLPYLSGCAMLFHARTWIELGGFEESYFAYFEDTDFGLRAAKRGKRQALVPGSTIYHKVSASSGELSPFRIYLFSRNRFVFMKQHADWHWFPTFILVQVFLRAIWSLKLLWQLNGPRCYKAFLLGTLDGIRSDMRNPPPIQ